MDRITKAVVRRDAGGSTVTVVLGPEFEPGDRIFLDLDEDGNAAKVRIVRELRYVSTTPNPPMTVDEMWESLNEAWKRTLRAKPG